MFILLAIRQFKFATCIDSSTLTMYL